MKLASHDERCTGCRTCELACALCRYGEINPKKAALRSRGEFPAPGRYHIEVCVQCGVCESVCPEGAISHTEDGVYVIDRESCTGCLMCVAECPFDVLYVHRDEKVPIKCDLCGDCVAACPRDVLYFTES